MSKIKFCTFYSGSSANSAYIEINGRAILVDAGASMKRTGTALSYMGKTFSDIDAVFVTHEHSDHIAGLPMITKHHKIPIIANTRTLHKIYDMYYNMDSSLKREMPTGATAVRGDFCVKSFASSHDGVEPVGYVVTCGNIKIGILTDTGEISLGMRDALSGCRAVLIESNHDEFMLRTGPYPYPLQQRILSKTGHLSNLQCAEFAKELIMSGTERVFLGHLSAENNTPAKAMETVCDYLEKNGIINGRDVIIEVSPRFDVSGVFEID